MDESGRLTKKERRALRREERSLQNISSAQKNLSKKVFVWAVLILLITGAGYFGFKGLKGATRVSEIGESFPIEGRDHVADGTKVDYKTNPPTSGPHYAVPSNWGVIDHEIPDEAAVHNLEHGGVWVTYKPGVTPAAIDELKSIVRDIGGKLLLTPRSKNDKDIALASWGRYYKFDLNPDGSFDASKVRDYINQYLNTGPELIPVAMPGKDY